MFDGPLSQFIMLTKILIASITVSLIEDVGDIPYKLIFQLKFN